MPIRRLGRGLEALIPSVPQPLQERAGEQIELSRIELNPKQPRQEMDPEALERFLRGALKGIEYASANVEEALDIVLKFAPQELREQQEFMLKTELARASAPATENNDYGWQKLCAERMALAFGRHYPIEVRTLTPLPELLRAGGHPARRTGEGPGGHLPEGC